MGKSREGNHIFYVVNTQNALQISLKSQSEAPVRDGAKSPQIQIPASKQSWLVCEDVSFKILLMLLCLHLPAVGVF